ncbi:MAG: alanine--glyoxylate aminotransferase family protein [Planctomycetes bacterium]|nr:alanine--glyoxylate aminotransferase family protein [Planctomycetota bacterium]
MEDFERSYCLLCPGPVNVRPEVACALTAYEFCHREEEFSALLSSLEEKLLAVAGVRRPELWAAVLVTGSGTAANEAVLSSVPAPGERVLVLANGEFGERLAAISRIHNPGTECLAQPWGQPLDLARVEAHLAAHRVGLVAMVHHETSTGMKNPVETVGRLAARHGARLFVDGVSSFSADPLDLDASGVTFLSSSAGKALGAYPGLSFVLAPHEAFRSLAGREPRSRYLDLRRHYEFARDRSQTPHTPAIPLFLALHRALELVLEEGVSERHRRLASLATQARRRIAELGLAVLVPPADASSVLTSVVLPGGVSFERLRTALRERGFVIYGGKGPLEGRIVQISTVGDVGPDRFDLFFDSLAGALAAASGKRSGNAAVAPDVGGDIEERGRPEERESQVRPGESRPVKRPRRVVPVAPGFQDVEREDQEGVEEDVRRDLSQEDRVEGEPLLRRARA